MPSLLSSFLVVVALGAFISIIGSWVSVKIAKLIYSAVEIFCLVVSTVLYYKIYLTVRRHKNQIQSLHVQQNEQNAEVTSLNFARRIKLAVGTYYVYLVFLVCYLPRTCLEIVVIISGENTTTEHLTGLLLDNDTTQFISKSVDLLLEDEAHSTRCHQHTAKHFPRVTINPIPPGVFIILTLVALLRQFE